MPTIETNGINLHYEERGSGEPLICIMGITAAGSVWELHVEEWQKHFRCIIVDNRGVGLSDKPVGPYTTAMMADDYAGLMDELGIESAFVVGCSMGSTIAQQLAIRHPAKVKKSILMCTWARCDRYATAVFEHMKTIKARLTADEFMNYIQLLIFAKAWWDDDANHQSMMEGRMEARNDPNPQPLHGLEAQAAACIGHNTLAQLPSIKCPCLVIGGKDDIFTPKWMAEETSAAIPNSRLHLYDGAGHAFHWECIDDFNVRTVEWLKGSD